MQAFNSIFNLHCAVTTTKFQYILTIRYLNVTKATFVIRKIGNFAACVKTGIKLLLRDKKIGKAYFPWNTLYTHVGSWTSAYPVMGCKTYVGRSYSTIMIFPFLQRLNECFLIYDRCYDVVLQFSGCPIRHNFTRFIAKGVKPRAIRGFDWEY